MKKRLLDILACPVCKGSLKLDVVEETTDEVIAGTLGCSYCKAIYPIQNSIPNLLPPESKSQI